MVGCTCHPGGGWRGKLGWRRNGVGDLKSFWTTAGDLPISGGSVEVPCQPKSLLKKINFSECSQVGYVKLPGGLWIFWLQQHLGCTLVHCEKLRQTSSKVGLQIKASFWRGFWPGWAIPPEFFIPSPACDNAESGLLNRKWKYIPGCPGKEFGTSSQYTLYIYIYTQNVECRVNIRKVGTPW